MKRTKELYYRPHPLWQDREGVSGCTKLDGEDESFLILKGFLNQIIDFDFRNKAYQQQQRLWIDAQIKEKEMIKQMQNESEKAYSTQTHELNRMKFFLIKEMNNKN